MAKSQVLPPSARSLSASLRDLGYSLETAVADIIDNSISAQATSIDIMCDMSFESPVLAILDNGTGMSENELLAAMRHGTSGPEIERLRTDLGRFGLGLKTASFSQCRQLTVVSAQGGQLCGAEWDLDVVNDEDDWVISVLENSDILNIPFAELIGTDGTLVLWRKIDRLFEGRIQLASATLATGQAERSTTCSTVEPISASSTSLVWWAMMMRSACFSRASFRIST